MDTEGFFGGGDFHFFPTKAAASSFDSGHIINYTEEEIEQQPWLPRDLVINIGSYV